MIEKIVDLLLSCWITEYLLLAFFISVIVLFVAALYIAGTHYPFGNSSRQ